MCGCTHFISGSIIALRFPDIFTQWWRHRPHLDTFPLLSTWNKTFKCFLLVIYTFNHGQIEDCSQELLHFIALQMLNKMPFNILWKLWYFSIYPLNIAFTKTTELSPWLIHFILTNASHKLKRGLLESRRLLIPHADIFRFSFHNC